MKSDSLFVSLPLSPTVADDGADDEPAGGERWATMTLSSCKNVDSSELLADADDESAVCERLTSSCGNVDSSGRNVDTISAYVL